MIIVATSEEISQNVIDEGGEPLYSLCQKEAENFSLFLRNASDDSNNAWLYKGGLSDWEKNAISSYLYQKLKGRF